MTERPDSSREEGHVPGPAGGAADDTAFTDRIGVERKPKKRRPEPSPVQRAIGLLSRREHSRKELAAKLSARGVSADDAETAVERMATEGWQDDQRFALSLARMRMSNGYGPIRIRAEIGTHGLSEDITIAALDALRDSGDADWPERARDLVRRRYGSDVIVTRDPRMRRKVVDFLMRRGFDGDSIRHAMREETDG